MLQEQSNTECEVLLKKGLPYKLTLAPSEPADFGS